MIDYKNHWDYNISALNISQVALDRAKQLLTPVEAEKVKWIVEDVSNPNDIKQLGNLDLWHDRSPERLALCLISQKVVI